jgi:hypothetical protein
LNASLNLRWIKEEIIVFEITLSANQAKKQAENILKLFFSFQRKKV